MCHKNVILFSPDHFTDSSEVHTWISRYHISISFYQDYKDNGYFCQVFSQQRFCYAQIASKSSVFKGANIPYIIYLNDNYYILFIINIDNIDKCVFLFCTGFHGPPKWSEFSKFCRSGPRFPKFPGFDPWIPDFVGDFGYFRFQLSLFGLIVELEFVENYERRLELGPNLLDRVQADQGQYFQ